MLGLALIAATAYQPLAAKTKLMPKAYMFGFAASFNDSIVYFTQIQEVDSVWAEGKKDFLAGRSNYSYQLRNYIERNMKKEYPTCVVISSFKRKDVEKKYKKMKKQYTEKNAGKYDVHYISDADFRFYAIDMSDSK